MGCDGDYFKGLLRLEGVLINYKQFKTVLNNP